MKSMLRVKSGQFSIPNSNVNLYNFKRLYMSKTSKYLALNSPMTSEQKEERPEFKMETLKLVQVIFRHGDRGPDNIQNGQVQFGSLNKNGHLRLLSLGKVLRKRYVNFLTDNLDEVTAESSEVARCVDSAVHVLKGLYSSMSTTLDAEIVKRVHSRPMALDNILFPAADCPEVELELSKSIQNAKDFIKKHEELFKCLRKNFNVKSFMDIAYLRETIHQRSTSESMVKVTKSQFEEIEYIVNQMPQIYFGSPRMKLIKASGLLQKLFANMKRSKSDSSNIQRLHLFCTHDLMIAFLELGLETFTRMFNFGESLIFELHQVNSEYFIAIYRLSISLNDENGSSESFIKIWPSDDREMYQNFTIFEDKLKHYLKFEYPAIDESMAKVKFPQIPLHIEDY